MTTREIYISNALMKFYCTDCALYSSVKLSDSG
jgi:hypothetical protein